jgi:hypothetical protein
MTAQATALPAVLSLGEGKKSMDPKNIVLNVNGIEVI